MTESPAEEPPTYEIVEGKCSLIGLGLTAIPQEIKEQAASILHLDLNLNSLQSTHDLLPFTNLETLVLDNNELESLEPFPKCPRLHTLWLNKNKLRNLEAILDALEGKVPALRFFSLLGNPGAPSLLTGATREEYERYRIYTIYRCGPALKFLDSFPVLKEELAAAKERGKFFRTAKPKQDDEPPEPVSPEQNNANRFYGPEEHREGKHSSYFGYTRQVYSGKSSEGNRFIVDNQL